VGLPLEAWKDACEHEKFITGKIASRLEMVGDDTHALLMLDREFAARVFVAGSPLDPVAYALVN
jgi:hypothetical protein